MVARTHSPNRIKINCDVLMTSKFVGAKIGVPHQIPAKEIIIKKNKYGSPPKREGYITFSRFLIVPAFQVFRRFKGVSVSHLKSRVNYVKNKTVIAINSIISCIIFTSLFLFYFLSTLGFFFILKTMHNQYNRQHNMYLYFALITHIMLQKLKT